MAHQHSTTQTYWEGTCVRITSGVDTEQGRCYTKSTYPSDMFNFFEDLEMDQVHATLSALIDELHATIEQGNNCEQIVEQIHQLNEAL